MKRARVCVPGLVLVISSVFSLVSAAETSGPARRLKAIDLKKVSPNFIVAIQVGEAGGKIFFAGNDGIHGRELWMTDGTVDGTRLVKDINPGPGASLPSNLVGNGGILFFVADDGTHGRELWRSDGTPEGTTLVKDIQAGPETSRPSIFPAFHGLVLMGADDGVHGAQLWKSDGTDAGTVALKDIQPLDFLPGPMEYKGDFYFLADDAVHGWEMWKTDGTEAGTVLADVHSGGAPVQAVPFAVLNERLLFTALDDAHGEALWRTDGTAAGTTFVKDVSADNGYFGHGPITVIGDVLYFAADDSIHGNELWRTDGTDEGTFMVKDIDALASALPDFPRAAVLADGSFLFAANDAEHGYELWRSDGTEAGTRLVKDIRPGRGFAYPIAGMTGLLGGGIFGADDGAHGPEPWRSDGTEAGTVQVQDIVPGFDGSFPDNFIPIGNRLFFTARDGVWAGRAAILMNQPEQALRDLGEEVAGLGLSNGTERQLTRRLEAAVRALGASDTDAAIRDLEEFMRDIDRQSPRKIDGQSAADLLDFAQDIVSLLRGAFSVS